MKSPEFLSQKLARQWQSANHREQRLLGKSLWPLQLKIARPSANELKNHPTQVKNHLQNWRQETIGQVQWVNVNYQSASKTIKIPEYWFINSPSEWIAACRNLKVRHEFDILSKIVAQTKSIFHSLLVRQRSLWLNHPATIIIQCCDIAMQLQPGMAAGLPLRTISLPGMDTKFLETYHKLLMKLLNVRYQQDFNTNVNSLRITNLKQFLDAEEDKKQWLLVIPLADNLLPFQQLRLRASELTHLRLPGSHLLIIENEQCRYHLPPLNNTIAILGAGLNLSWMKNPDFQHKIIAYWGDIDSWGLKMLSRARQAQPKLTALLMSSSQFQTYQQYTVPEPKSADKSVPLHLTEDEAQLYQHLIQLTMSPKAEKNRLEQEFIPLADAKKALLNWHLQNTLKQ